MSKFKVSTSYTLVVSKIRIFFQGNQYRAPPHNPHTPAHPVVHFSNLLIIHQKYEISCSSKVKILINKDSQKIISKFNNTFFVAEFTGIYNIEVISLDKDILSKIQIIEVNPECEETNLDTIKVKNIILKDDNGNDFKLFVKDSKLIIEPN